MMDSVSSLDPDVDLRLLEGAALPGGYYAAQFLPGHPGNSSARRGSEI